MTEEYKVGLTVDYDQFLAKINAAVATLEASSTTMANSIQKMSNHIDTGMTKAAASTTSNVAKIEASLTQMKKTITNVEVAITSMQNVFLRLAAVLAGGAMFKEQINSSIAWIDGIKRMKEQLGITAEEASVMQVALHKVGLTAEEYTGVAIKLERQIANNSKEFAHFGIETKNLDGTWKDGKTLITEVVTEMGRYAEGTSRNIALTDLMKRSQIDLSKYLRLTAEFMAEEKKKAEELNLIFGNDKIAAVRSYKDAMADFNLVMESANLNIMPTLLAGLTNFAILLSRLPKYLKDAWNSHKELWEVILGLIAAYAIHTAWIWAAGIAQIAYNVILVTAKTAMMLFTLATSQCTIAFGLLTSAEMIACGGWIILAIGAIATAFFGWRAVVNFVIDAFLRLWNILKQVFFMAKAVGLAMTGDLSGAGAAWDESIKVGVEKLGIGEDHVANIEKKLKDMFTLAPGGAGTGSLRSGEDLTAPTREKSGGGSPYSTAKTGFQEALAKAELDADLANVKLGFDKKIALYHQYLDAVVKTEKEQHEYMVGLYHLESDAKKDQLEMDKAQLDKEIAEGKAKTEEAYKREVELLIKKVALTKAGSKERIEAETAVINKEKEHQKLLDEIQKTHIEGIRAANLSLIDLEDQKNAMLVEYGQMTQEKLDAIMIQHEDARYQIKLDTLRAEQAAEKDNQVKWEQTQNQIDELTAKHVQTRLQLQNNLYKEQNSVMLDFKNKFQGSLDGMFQDIMKGTFNLTKFIGKLADDLLSSLTKKLSKQATDSLFGGLLGGGKGNKEVTQEQTKQTAITAVVQAGNTARTLATKTGMMAAAAAGGAAATAMINANQAAFMATLQMIQSMGAAIGSIQPEGPLIAAGITSGVAAAQAQLSAAAATAQGSIQASYAVIGSAAGGADIGYDRLLQVHKEELVLPAAISGGLKNMIQAFQNTTNQVHVPVAVNGGGFSSGFAGSVRAGIEDVVMGILQREANR